MNELRSQNDFASEVEDSPSDDVPDSLVKRIRRTTGLECNEAKVVLHYAIATHGLPKLDKFPILAILGPAGTGKTTILRILQLLVRKPVWMDGKETKAVIRDSLPDQGTALIDEADDMDERMLINRYDRQSGTHTVNRGNSKTGWEQKTMNLFGATALHRRLPFKDPAILSRSIVVSTKPRSSVHPLQPEEFAELKGSLKDLADNVDWAKVKELGGSRIKDTWAPLMEVARYLEDTEWLEWAESQMAKAGENLHAGQEEEPTAAVFQALLAEALGGLGGNPDERVALGQVTERLAKGGRSLTSWQVGSLLRDLGFEIGKKGGVQYVYTGGTEKLVEAGRSLGVQDEWLEEHTQESRTV